MKISYKFSPFGAFSLSTMEVYSSLRGDGGFCWGVWAWWRNEGLGL